MSAQDRRTFLKRAAGAVAAGGTLSVAGCEADETGAANEATGRPVLDPALLAAVADDVLPVAALGSDGTLQVVQEFVTWVDEYQPVAELDHPYLTDELRYAPADPAPRWGADLQALDLEARQRDGVGYVDLPQERQRALLERALAGSGDQFPRPAQAGHVALGLLAWFYASSLANDLCYQVRIGRHDCRGIETLPAEPPAPGAGT